MSKRGHGRKVRNAAEARALLEEWSASGEAMKPWCQARGISWYSLSARRGWQRRTSTPRLVEVEVAHAPAALAADPVYRMLVGDVHIEVGDDFREDTLQRLLGVLRAC